MKRQATPTQFFYQNGKLVTVNQGGQKRAIFRSTDIPLAEVATGEHQATGLLEVDQNGSVLKVSGGPDEEESHSYSAYGHDPSRPSEGAIVGFNGQPIDALVAGYFLGNGYRLYNPKLMRFHAADSISPFNEGGLNAYVYCSSDPVNFDDPSGHMPRFLTRAWKGIRNRLKLKTPSPQPNTPTVLPPLRRIQLLSEGTPHASTPPLSESTPQSFFGSHDGTASPTNLQRQNLTDPPSYAEAALNEPPPYHAVEQRMRSRSPSITSRSSQQSSDIDNLSPEEILRRIRETTRITESHSTERADGRRSVVFFRR